MATLGVIACLEANSFYFKLSETSQTKNERSLIVKRKQIYTTQATPLFSY
jgi:hypothetical protein